MSNFQQLASTELGDTTFIDDMPHRLLLPPAFIPIQIEKDENVWRPLISVVLVKFF